MLDAIPVTAVGKPYKLPLRADATRRALLAAVVPIGPDVAVDARIEDGATVATVTVPGGTDRAAVEAVLGRYAVAWELVVGR